MHARTAATALSVAVVALLPVAPPVAAQSASPDPAAGGITLTLLHNNDGESSLLPIPYQVDATTSLAVGGVAAYASVLGREIAQAQSAGHAVVTVYAGDSFLASATLACSLPPQPEDTPVYDAVAQSLMPYDVHVFGNHEFDHGPDFLRRFVTSFVNADGTPEQPFLSANLDFGKEKAWRRLLARKGLIDGAPKGGRVVARSAIVRDAATGAAFGIVSATTPLLPTISSPRKVKVTPDLPSTAKKVQKEIDRLTKQGIDKIILVSHLQDIQNDTQLVALLTGVDVAVGGGGDELLLSDTVPPDAQLLPGEAQVPQGTYPILGTDAGGRTVPIVTTAGNYTYLGRLDVQFDAAGEVVRVLPDSSYPRRVIPETQDGDQILDLGISDAVPPTQDQLTQVVEPVQACLETFAQTPVARSEVVLDVSRGAADPFDLGVRSAETNGGDLVADAFLAAYDTHAAASGLPPRGADNLVIAVQNGGGIRQNAGDLLPAGGAAGGDITRLDTLDLLPFDNTLVSVDGLTPADLDAVLEHSCAGNGGGGFLQVSGVRYTCDLTRQPGDQALDVVYTAGTPDAADDVVVVAPDGTVTADAGSLRLVTISFTAAGGDDYTMLADRPITKLAGADGTAVFYEPALREYLGAFPVAGDPAFPTIAADDARYADPEGEGRITVIRP